LRGGSIRGMKECAGRERGGSAAVGHMRGVSEARVNAHTHTHIDTNTSTHTQTHHTTRPRRGVNAMGGFARGVGDMRGTRNTHIQNTHTLTYTHMQKHKNTQTQTPTLTHKNTHIHTHTHTHKQTQAHTHHTTRPRRGVKAMGGVIGRGVSGRVGNARRLINKIGRI
jgi:hypothetical protein